MAFILQPLRIDNSQSKSSYLEPRYMLCLPQAGLIDKCSVIMKCINYCKKFNRVLIIDSTRDWFNDDINEYINIHSSYVYTGAADTITNKINNLSTYPKGLNIMNMDGIIYKDDIKPAGCYLNNINLSIDLDRDYDERVIIYSHHKTTNGEIVDLFDISTISPKVLDVYKSRRAQIPKSYIGIHIRNTDYTSDVPQFIELHKKDLYNEPIFLASDNSNNIETIKKTFGSNIYTFANIPNNNGKPIHEGYKRTKEEARQYNVDTFVDILLLAAADKYYFSCKKSGFSLAIEDLRKKPELIKRLLA